MTNVLNNFHNAFFGHYVSERRVRLLDQLNNANRISNAEQLRSDMVAIFGDFNVAYSEAKEKVGSRG